MAAGARAEEEDDEEEAPLRVPEREVEVAEDPLVAVAELSPESVADESAPSVAEGLPPFVDLAATTSLEGEAALLGLPLPPPTAPPVALGVPADALK